ncbi:unnamed protein product [Hermetia illucens]|uniref:Fibronectin type III domain-containing protein n=1 Tax=Hermetia illucens TaxID=343691 RepID=A0A7R8UCW0_HERIL|nr:unnamed protein product [Hermetia illucens]
MFVACFIVQVVQQVAGHSEAVVLDHLLPNTQYQLTVTAVVSGHRYKSRQVIFKTLELSKGGSGDSMAPHSGHNFGDFSDSAFTTTTGSPPNATTRELPTIRGVEVGIVVLVLIVWAGAIALFFNRWGKIRMLLPYQPDYKQEQLKVPGTGVCTGSACNGQHSHQLEDAESVSSRRQITQGYIELLQKIQDDFVDEENTNESCTCESYKGNVQSKGINCSAFLCTNA